VYANEIIEEALCFAQGFMLNDEFAAIDEIKAAGPGGSFLASALTLKLFRKGYYTSQIFPRLSLEKWEATGHPQAEELLRDHTQRLLAELKPLDDHAELIEQGESFVRNVTRRSEI